MPFGRYCTLHTSVVPSHTARPALFRNTIFPVKNYGGDWDGPPPASGAFRLTYSPEPNDGLPPAPPLHYGRERLVSPDVSVLKPLDGKFASASASFNIGECVEMLKVGFWGMDALGDVLIWARVLPSIAEGSLAWCVFFKRQGKLFREAWYLETQAKKSLTVTARRD